MSTKIVNLLIHREIIKADDAELYLFGFQNLWLDLLNLAVLIALSVICGFFTEFLIFWVFYAPLRHFAGGYHAQSAAKCFFFTVGIVLLSFGCMKYIPWSSPLNLSVVLISTAIIVLLAPIADANKLLDADEFRVFKKMTRIVLFLESVIFLVLLYGGLSQAVNSVTLSLAVAAGMLVLGAGKQHFGAFCRHS